MGRSALAVLLGLFALSTVAAEPLPATKPLTLEGDLAAQMVAGIDRYLMRELADSVAKRKPFWKVDRSSPEAYDQSVQPNRDRLRAILGIVDPRVPFTEPEVVVGVGQEQVISRRGGCRVRAIRWPVLPGVDGEGLLVEGDQEAPHSCVVVLPDADVTPEMAAGLAPGGGQVTNLVLTLARCGTLVVVPVLIDRKDAWSGNDKLERWTNQPHREFLYRMAYEMGRHPLGYEVQKVLAVIDWFEQSYPKVRHGVAGFGEGGLIALYAGAVDTRIQATLAAGCFAPWENLWDEPIYRNVWRLLREFGAAEVAALHGARNPLLLADSSWPEIAGPPTPRANRRGAAPGRLTTPDPKTVEKEFDRLNQIGFATERKLLPRDGRMSDEMLRILGRGNKLGKYDEGPVDQRKGFDPSVRQKRQLDQLVAFTQKVMRDSERLREANFWNKLDTSSLEKYADSCKPPREQLAEIIGALPPSTGPLNPRSREILDEPKWKGYEVVLDVFPDVFAYGILLLPKDLKPGEKRPVVVCQHGLEGRPIDVVKAGKKTVYNNFAGQLADRGYVVYAPQNPYIGQDKFRVLQRKANLLGLSLFSFIVRQHERTIDFLETLPSVDPKRIAFYGLSYGGKTAMRVPALVPRYCLSICSADFNEWTWKNASVDFRGSYLWTIEYEMPEFNLGSTIVYAEMAALIAPRPFMVERGHNDGVGIDEWVAYEYAKVRRHYSRLKIPERTAIEFFAGGHEIRGEGTFRFLEQHLK